MMVAFPTLVVILRHCKLQTGGTSFVSEYCLTPGDHSLFKSY